MGMILTGFVNGMRPVGGIAEQGAHKGEEWHFLSIEVIDPRYGNVYSCQLRSEDTQYAEFVKVEKGKADDGSDLHSLVKDLTDHKVKMTVKSQAAGEREVKDKKTGQKSLTLVVRTQVTNLRDLGLPKDEEE